MTAIKIRQLDIHDANDFRTIRLSGLQNSPEMFGSTYAVESKRPLALFAERIEKSVIFAAYHEQKIVGVIIFLQESGLKSAYKANIYGFYIEPQFRNRGIANQLLQAVIHFAQQHVEQIMLSVVSDNNLAIALYKKHGFQTYGIELRAMKNDAGYQDDVLMVLFLEKGTNKQIPII